MIRVAVNGALGRMGSITVNKIEAAEDMELAAGVDAFSDGGAVFKSLKDIDTPVDAVIDFSHHSLTAELLEWAVENNVAVILCTTGHDEGEKSLIRESAKKIPVFYSANMSMGVAVLAELARKTASLFPDADIEIVETHHNRKSDAPSGTALMLGGAIRSVRPELKYSFGRSGMGKREKNEIGFHSIRRGNIAGIHEIIITTENESITLKHEVYDRALFADGALTAARFTVGKPAGLYDMTDIAGSGK